jgi:ketosteroid isomerase-like protein
VASANVELVRAILEANQRGDYSATGWADPAIEFVIADGPSPGSWNGLEGLAAGWRELASAWDELSTEAEEFRVLDEQRVLVLIHRRGRGKASGLKLEPSLSKGASVFHVRGGKVTKLVVYMQRARALTDLGLAAGLGPPLG